MDDKRNELIDRIDSAKKRQKDWFNNVKEYEEIYSCGASKDETRINKKRSRYNILFSNTQILLAALFTEIPRLIIRKRTARQDLTSSTIKLFNDTVVDIIKKVVDVSVNGDNIKKVIDAFKLDVLLSGRGVLWCRFEGKYDTMPDGQTILTDESIKVEHVYYRDFLMSAGRTWEQVWWIARRHKMTKEDIYKQFPHNAHYPQADINIEKNPRNADYPQEEESNEKELIEVWEIWDKSAKKVYFVTEKSETILKSEDDPYNIDGFFPTCEPLRFISNNSNLNAAPEYELYKEEAVDLSVCSQRIAALIKSIKARALYSASNRKIADDLSKAGDNEYVAVEVNAQINEIGIDKLFTYDPIEMKQRVSQGLYEQQKNLISNIYEITGISDIMRSISAVNETAEAVAKKSKFGSLRLQRRQESINAYIKEIYRIICSLICELFTAETLERISGVRLPATEDKEQFTVTMQQRQAIIEQSQKALSASILNGPAAQAVNNAPVQPAAQNPADAQAAAPLPQINPKTVEFYKKPSYEQVKAYLEDNKLRDYLFTVECDADIFEDEKQRFENRAGTIDFVFKVIQSQIPFIMQNPEFGKVTVRLMMFVLSGSGLPLELQSEIESGLDGLIEKVKNQNRQKQPPPEMLLAQAEIIKGNAEMLKAQIKQQEVEVQAAQAGVKLNLEKQKIDNDLLSRSL